jgi:hypothetical protein
MAVPVCDVIYKGELTEMGRQCGTILLDDAKNVVPSRMRGR